MLKNSQGFNLIELAVSLAIFAILVSMAIPSYSEWIRNTRIRSTAESIQNGLQLAKAEAVRRNTNVRFQLTTTLTDDCALDTAGPSWVISLDDATGKCLPDPDRIKNDNPDPPRIVRVRSGAEGASANTTIAAGQTTMIFNGMGRLAPAAAVEIDVNDTSDSTARNLRIVISAGGQIRMCDPALPNTDVQSCP